MASCVARVLAIDGGGSAAGGGARVSAKTTMVPRRRRRPDLAIDSILAGRVRRGWRIGGVRRASRGWGRRPDHGRCRPWQGAKRSHTVVGLPEKVKAKGGRPALASAVAAGSGP